MSQIIKNDILVLSQKYQAEAISIAKSLWNHPEGSAEEFFASNLIKEKLKLHKFKIKPSKLSPTSFKATFGTKNNIEIAILGEYDALPNLGSNNQFTYGHGCGHNLLGAGSYLGAIILSKLIGKYDLKFQIVYYGCSDEEEGAGKTLLVRENFFAKTKAVFTWHPATHNASDNEIWMGSKIVEINFVGESAHDVMHPNSGMNANQQMINFLNKLPQDKGVSFSYIIKSTNQSLAVTPSLITVELAIRSFDQLLIDSTLQKLKAICDNLIKINGGQIIIKEKAYYPVTYHDQSLRPFVFNNLKLYLNDQQYTKAELLLAQKSLESISSLLQNKDELKSLLNTNLVFKQEIQYIFAPTDVGVVSKVCPTIQFQTLCFPVGMGLHTIDATRFSNSSIAMKGMVLAGKVLAGSIIDFFLSLKIKL